MKILFVFAIAIFFLSNPVEAQVFYGTIDLKIFRDGRDKEFRNKKESPLKDEDFTTFKTLNYYRVNSALRVKADFTSTPDEKFFMMPTSSGNSARLVKYGVLTFKIKNKMYKLSVYRSDPENLKDFPEYKDILLIPFMDLTNKKQTYAGGRYINLIQPLDKTVILDFNLAYNPSCSYGSGRYSCPIPPKENSLAAQILAGEKRFAYFGQKH